MNKNILASDPVIAPFNNGRIILSEEIRAGAETGLVVWNLLPQAGNYFKPISIIIQALIFFLIPIFNERFC